MDGGAVSCASLAAVTRSYEDGGTSPDAPDRLEASGRFNLLAYDTVDFGGGGINPGTEAAVALFKTGTGFDFLAQVELWYGQLNTVTKLPQGARGAVGCFDTTAPDAGIFMSSGQMVRELNPAHQGQVIRVYLPAQ